jgi:glycosyltransferase involved in cell wall biosynthesis
MPRVTFVVPCYRLAHLLGECVESILSQTFADFEVLIMDDCSPDRTPEVARAFADPRVRHVRHEANVGHLRNYNIGIEMAQGEYVWLISADDRLRKPYVLERFVGLMDRYRQVGYVFCPVMRFDGDVETTLYGAHGEQDWIKSGHEFLQVLANGNSVPAASGLVRRTCYERYGAFPLDLPFAGDWYMWALFALHSKVAYFAEPMVGWRVHGANMTHQFRARPTALIDDEVRVLVRVREQARESRHPRIARLFTQAIQRYYAWRVAAGAAPDLVCHMTPAEMDASLERWCTDDDESRAIRGAAYAALADAFYDAGDRREARECYEAALRLGTFAPRTGAKYLLLGAGRVGDQVRATLARTSAP